MTRYLSPKDIATALGISRRHAYRLIESLPRVHIGACVRVDEADLTNYLQRIKERPWGTSTDDIKTDPGTATTRRPRESASSEASEPTTKPSPKSDSAKPSWLRPLKRVAANNG